MKYQSIYSMLLISSIACTTYAGVVSRKTYVKLINNTPFTLNIDRTILSGSPFPEGRFSQDSATAIVPGQIIEKALSIERNVGVKKDLTYYFNTTINLPKDQKATIAQQIIGTATDSKIAVSATLPGESGIGWYNDRNPHSKRITSGTDTFVITYYLYYTGGEDDVVYTIDYIDESAFTVDPVGDNGLNVLQYNVYMRSGPLFMNGQTIRANLIPERIKDRYDLIVFNEAFETKPREILIQKLKANGYQYITNVIGYEKGLENGGLFIVSKWPIIKKEGKLYKDICTGSDCLAKKGMMYVQINKNGKIYNIFATHTNAWPDKNSQKIREKQFEMLRDFIKEQKIPTTQPVLIIGDLNVDMLKYKNEYANMLRTLNATHPEIKGYTTATWDAAINKIADQSDKNLKEFLDYVLYANDYRKPDIAYNRVLIFKSTDNWMPTQDKIEQYFDKKYGSKHTTLFDLSDHFPVYGHFVWNGY